VKATNNLHVVVTVALMQFLALLTMSHGASATEVLSCTGTRSMSGTMRDGKHRASVTVIIESNSIKIKALETDTGLSWEIEYPNQSGLCHLRPAGCRSTFSVTEHEYRATNEKDADVSNSFFKVLNWLSLNRVTGDLVETQADIWVKTEYMMRDINTSLIAKCVKAKQQF
jgi:hypothetical protein